MAIQGALTNVGLYLGEFDVSGDTNHIDFQISAKPLPATTFVNGGYEISIPGLKKLTADHEGLLQLGSGLLEEIEGLAGKFAQTGVPATIAPTGGADGEPAYFFSGLQTTFDEPMQVGDIAKFKTHLENDNAPGGLARGTIGHPKTARTTSGTGTVQTLGAVGASQKLYGILHVFAASGSSSPTLVVKIRSAVTSFATITDRITFSTVNSPTLTSQFATPVAGAITDTFWRVDWTVTGSSPSFTFAVALAIL